MASIKEQVKLPAAVALEVVLQGIRIRFGRSVVTITGVIMGIAFLGSILTGQVLKRGVGEEDQLRTEVKRMYNFLVSETGPPRRRTIGIVQNAPLEEKEIRLMKMLSEEGLASVRWAAIGDNTSPERLTEIRVDPVAVSDVGQGVSAVMVVGELPDGATPAHLVRGARQSILAFTRPGTVRESPEIRSTIRLDKKLSEEEMKERKEEEKKERFRNSWIVTIAMLVTVFGITNSMLMSVTERFREIGTMKCLGALSGFVKLMFLIESAIMGIIGGLMGAVVGAAFSFVAYAATYGFGLTFVSMQAGVLAVAVSLLLSVIVGIVLSVLAAIYPASVAARMVPADALRTNI